MLDPKYADAHYNLGPVLHEQGQFAEARTRFRRLELLAADAPLRPGASDQLRQCERLLGLEAQLAPVLKGEQQPADDAVRLGLAKVCEYQRRYAAAARFIRRSRWGPRSAAYRTTPPWGVRRAKKKGRSRAWRSAIVDLPCGTGVSAVPPTSQLDGGGPLA